MTDKNSLLAKFWLLPSAKFAPRRMHGTDAGFDLAVQDDIRIDLHEFQIFSLGFAVKPPDGFYSQIYLRSSAPRRYGLLMPNGSGIIDPSYCGPDDIVSLQVWKFREGTQDLNQITILKKGTRIAQLIFMPLFQGEFVRSQEVLADVCRGGLGSTGVEV